MGACVGTRKHAMLSGNLVIGNLLPDLAGSATNIVSFFCGAPAETLPLPCSACNHTDVGYLGKRAALPTQQRLIGG